MIKPKTLISNLSEDSFFNLVKLCTQLPLVKAEVHKNHDNNLWWPLNIDDWRLRMVIAGWSTRVSYNMISTYQDVVSKVNKIGYDKLCELSEAELKSIIGSLGLSKNRIQYLHSIKDFIAKIGDKRNLMEKENDELISNFAKMVRGASFKVAQCAVLYAKGYHCGIFPIDSGMKDMLGPCWGLQLPKGSYAHEVMRKKLEQFISARQNEYYELSQQVGYSNLQIPMNTPPIWWVHLSLIYFKRLYCNKHKPLECPLRENVDFGRYIGSMCCNSNPVTGGYKYVVLEGIDCVGKTTIANQLEKIGYNIKHSKYNPAYSSITVHYQDLIENTSPPVLFDRCFISEYTYGRAIRNNSRLSMEEIQSLLKILAGKGCLILYLKEDLTVMLGRLNNSIDKHQIILENIQNLSKEYDICMGEISEILPVYELSPSSMNLENILLEIQKIIDNE